MPNRDYAARSKKAGKGGNKLLIVIIVILLLVISGLSLWLLQRSTPQPLPTQQVKHAPKNTLPSPPEEIYSYIRDLENREVPVDKNANVVRLTKEQEQLLKQRKEEEARKQAQFEQQQIQSTDVTVVDASDQQSNEAAEEEKRRLELKKQEQAKKEMEAKATAQNAAKSGQPKVVGKFGIQCGAFKNKAQAENMQARLAMAGYNARITGSGEWNRVVVGPVGNRSAAAQAQANAKSVADCVIVGM